MRTCRESRNAKALYRKGVLLAQFGSHNKAEKRLKSGKEPPFFTGHEFETRTTSLQTSTKPSAAADGHPRCGCQRIYSQKLFKDNNFFIIWQIVRRTKEPLQLLVVTSLEELFQFVTGRKLMYGMGGKREGRSEKEEKSREGES
ncbi:hypothetical protein RND71_009735 [Anisodus tanguticus]|uniref:Uncharacterized protein n=1 Tax=Anisodus tanguticus TaxID=243964 RepID=A0AAE1SHV1_9SOLA|nr:hypothetical protein RND71_009735 [Anisodus tanguticus]